jgi:histidinol-phosphate/aromatic aminotransferase/cobyric acid decarboxylase-like protein
VLVNPNSPTGRCIPRAQLEPFLRRVPASTLVWIDETYIDYVGAHESLESFAITRPNVVICKSMSKVYALSGVRSAYLCASPHLLEGLRAITPPWAVSLPAQVAAVAALQDGAYYADRYRETHALRDELVTALPDLDVVPGVANFVLAHLPADGPTAAEVVDECRRYNLFIRDAANMGIHLGTHAIRMAVKDRATQHRMIDVLRFVMRSLNAASRDAAAFLQTRASLPRSTPIRIDSSRAPNSVPPAPTESTPSLPPVHS